MCGRTDLAEEAANAKTLRLSMVGVLSESERGEDGVRVRKDRELQVLATW